MQYSSGQVRACAKMCALSGFSDVWLTKRDLHSTRRASITTTCQHHTIFYGFSVLDIRSLTATKAFFFDLLGVCLAKVPARRTRAVHAAATTKLRSQGGPQSTATPISIPRDTH
jgi:hypothetical protein